MACNSRKFEPSHILYTSSARFLQIKYPPVSYGPQNLFLYFGARCPSNPWHHYSSGPSTFIWLTIVVDLPQSCLQVSALGHRRLHHSRNRSSKVLIWFASLSHFWPLLVSATYKSANQVLSCAIDLISSFSSHSARQTDLYYTSSTARATWRCVLYRLLYKNIDTSRYTSAFHFSRLYDREQAIQRYEWEKWSSTIRIYYHSAVASRWSKRVRRHRRTSRIFMGETKSPTTGQTTSNGLHLNSRMRHHWGRILALLALEPSILSPYLIYSRSTPPKPELWLNLQTYTHL